MPYSPSGRVPAGASVDTHRCADPQGLPSPAHHHTSPAQAESVRQASSLCMTETHEEAVERICTHVCVHYHTRMSLDACRIRIAKARHNPLLIGPTIGWECATCTGPVPIGQPIDRPALPTLSEHSSRYLRKRSYKCCKCGTDDISKFDKGHSRKCRDCVRASEMAKQAARSARDKAARAEVPRLRCCRCGCCINMGSRGNRMREELRLCGVCFRALNRAKKRGG